MSTAISLRGSHPLGFFDFNDIIAVYDSLSDQEKIELNRTLSNSIGLENKVNTISNMLEQAIFERIPASPDLVLEAVQRAVAEETPEEKAIIAQKLPNYESLPKNKKFQAKLLLNIPNEPLIVNGLNFGSPHKIMSNILSDRVSDKLFTNVVEPADFSLKEGLKSRAIPYIVGAFFGGFAIGSLFVYFRTKK